MSIYSILDDNTTVCGKSYAMLIYQFLVINFLLIYKQVGNTKSAPVQSLSPVNSYPAVRENALLADAFAVQLVDGNNRKQ